MHESTTHSELRSLIARYWYPRPLYLLAAEIGVHPANLSGVLRGRLPLRAEVATRIQESIFRAASEGGDAR